MTKETYRKITQPFRDNIEMAKGIHRANKICTLTMYMAYPMLVGFFFFSRNPVLLRSIFVPGISFVLLSLGRGLINRPRPYETFGMPPVIHKDTKGNSFPSRHVFSATIIAMTFLLISPWPPLGLLFLGLSLLLALVRVLSGVHYPSDVLAGLLLGILASYLGYIIV